MRSMQEQLTRYVQPSPAQDKIAAMGLEAIIEELEQGASVSQIAKNLGVGIGRLHEWLHKPERSARVVSAMQAGAEAYEARAVDILEEARQEIRDDPGISGSIVALARERAQAAWRQASVRDPRRYSDKRTLDVAVTHKHDVRELSTAELERLVASERTLTLDESTGEVSDQGGVLSERADE